MPPPVPDADPTDGSDPFARGALNAEVDAQPDGGTAPGVAERLPDGFAQDSAWHLDTLQDLSVLRSGVAERIAQVLPADPSRTPGDVPTALDHMLLVATELASNAIRHGRPPVLLRLHLPVGDGPVTEVLVETVDHDTSSLPQFVDGHEDGGRGMLLAARLALEVSWTTTATTKHVWARLRTDQLTQSED